MFINSTDSQGASARGRQDIGTPRPSRSTFERIVPAPGTQHWRTVFEEESGDEFCEKAAYLALYIGLTSRLTR